MRLDLFFKFLNRQVLPKEVGERSQAENSQASSNSCKGPYRSKAISSNKTEQRVSSASALLGEVKQETVNKCHFRKKPGHESGNCYSAKKKSIEERWKVARDKKLCFNCLKPSHTDHNYRNCRQPRTTVLPNDLERNFIDCFIQIANKFKALHYVDVSKIQ